MIAVVENDVHRNFCAESVLRVDSETLKRNAELIKSTARAGASTRSCVTNSPITFKGTIRNDECTAVVAVRGVKMNINVKILKKESHAVVDSPDMSRVIVAAVVGSDLIILVIACNVKPFSEKSELRSAAGNARNENAVDISIAIDASPSAKTSARWQGST